MGLGNGASGRNSKDSTDGTIFEELIRKFNEALNKNPGEHFTPRDVVHLMVRLLMEGGDDKLGREHPIGTVHDPCCEEGEGISSRDLELSGPALEDGIVVR
jgi:type I restriction-modification system DNA methylase subunit